VRKEEPPNKQVSRCERKREFWEIRVSRESSGDFRSHWHWPPTHTRPPLLSAPKRQHDVAKREGGRRRLRQENVKLRLLAAWVPVDEFELQEFALAEVVPSQRSAIFQATP